MPEIIEPVTLAPYVVTVQSRHVPFYGVQMGETVMPDGYFNSYPIGRDRAYERRFFHAQRQNIESLDMYHFDDGVYSLVPLSGF